MALWEYKVISSGKGGFATTALLESFLNQLGKDEWEIIDFQTQPDNPLAFHGLARRPTQREWTLEAAVAAAAKAEADKLRAELMSRQHSGENVSSDEVQTKDGEEKSVGDGEIRPFRNTDRDQDPDAPEDDEAEDWENWEAYDDDLPTFFDALRPHMRKNQKGPGQSVAVDFLSKRWDLPESDIVSALTECGFTLPESEDEAPAYIEFEGDLYWVERSGRGNYFINTREKPRPVFRAVQAKNLDPADPVAVQLTEEHTAAVSEKKRRMEEQAAREAAREAEVAARKAEQEARRQEAEARKAEEAARVAELAAQPLPEGQALLDTIRPMMRRNRRAPGQSGSVGYLAKALHHAEAELLEALHKAGLVIPEKSGDKAEYTEIENTSYWVNKDGRGGYWINAREKRERFHDRKTSEKSEETSEDEAVEQANESAGVSEEPSSSQTPKAAAIDESQLTQVKSENDESVPDSTEKTSEVLVESDSGDQASDEADASSSSLLLELQTHLKANRRTGVAAAAVDLVAFDLGQNPEALLETLRQNGLSLPEGDQDGKVVEVDGVSFWISLNAKDSALWLNARAPKSAPAKKRRPTSGGKPRKAPAKKKKTGDA